MWSVNPVLQIFVKIIEEGYNKLHFTMRYINFDSIYMLTL